MQPSTLANTVAVILAGGLGTRIRHLHPDVPKPMIPVAGRPFLEWVLHFLRRQGIGTAVISSGHLAEVVERHFAAHPVPGLTVQCVAEPTPLGTGGGLLHAVATSGLKPESWLVLNGDSMVFADLPLAAKPLATPAVQGVVVGVAMDDASRYGTLRFDAEGRLQSFEEKRPGAGVINAGIYFFKAPVVARFPAARPLSFEKDVFPRLLADGIRLDVSATTAPFLDIGTPESLAQAGEFIRANEKALTG